MLEFSGQLTTPDRFSYHTGLFRTDGRRPDGATLIPWSEGKYLAWDATIVHTCAASYVSPQAALIGPASVQAANRKTTKYGGLPSTPHFSCTLHFSSSQSRCHL